MRALGVTESVREQLRLRRRERGFRDEEKVEALVLLMAAGGTSADDIEVLRADRGFGRLLGRELPSADALLRFLYLFHDVPAMERAAARSHELGQESFVPEEGDALRGLRAVNTNLVRELAKRVPCQRATLDLDATVVESSKKEALSHDEGGRGYQPVVTTWAARPGRSSTSS